MKVKDKCHVYIQNVLHTCESLSHTTISLNKNARHYVLTHYDEKPVVRMLPT